MSESDFSKGLNRVFRRDAIKKSLEENPGQINTNRVREIEGQNFTHELTRALTEQLYVAEADKIKLLEVITQEIRERLQRIEDNRQLAEDGILEYSEILDEITRYLVVYLEPSVPPEVNDYNIHQLLQALSLIKDDNPENFYIIKQEIIREWKKVHRLKDKHLAGKKEWADQRTADFVNKVGESSSQAMSKPLEEILDQV